MIYAVQYELMYYCTCACMCFWGEREGKEDFGVWHGMGGFLGADSEFILDALDWMGMHIQWWYFIDVNYYKTNSSLSSAVDTASKL